MKGVTACLCLIVLPLICPVMSQDSAWSYSGPTGPSNWGKLPGSAVCHGRRQSPININTFETGQKSFPPFLFIGYDLSRPGPTRPTSMVNTGHTIRINLEGNYLVSGGGLPSRYKAVDVHLHWGSVNFQGSEHTKNDRAYPAEVHIVHYDTTRYRNIGEALTKPNGLAILGFWVKLGHHNSAWDVIINNLKPIKYANAPYQFKTSFAITSLLPNDFSRFYRYSGSLTTPGCYESAIWTIFDNEIVLSRAQIAKLRQLSKFATPPYGPGAGPEQHQRLVDNFRPIQRLWFRTIYQSWPHTSDSYYGGIGTGWTPKFPSIAGKLPASKLPASKPHAGPARFDTGMDETAEFEYDGYGAYNGYGRGMEQLGEALRNAQFGADENVYYYDNGYGNTNFDNQDDISDP